MSQSSKANKFFFASCWPRYKMWIKLQTANLVHGLHSWNLRIHIFMLVLCLFFLLISLLVLLESYMYLFQIKQTNVVIIIIYFILSNFLCLNNSLINQAFEWYSCWGGCRTAASSKMELFVIIGCSILSQSALYCMLQQS